MKRTLTLILAALLAALPIVSCGEASIDSNDTTTTSDDTTALEEPTITSGVPADYSLDGKTITIWYNTESSSVAETFTDLNPELTGDVLDDATYNANKKVEERLDCTLDFYNSMVGSSNTGAEVQKLILAQDDTFDMFHSTQWNTTNLVVEGYFLNMADADYISWDEPWWDYNYMQEMTIGEDKIYCLVGDFAVDRTRCLNCFYYNKDMYEDFYKDADGLYNEVLNGTWTWEKLRTICSEVYSDLNNDGKADREDRLGVQINDYYHLDSFFYATGARATERDKDDIPQIVLNNERVASIMQDLYSLVFETEGVYFSGPQYTDDLLNRQAFENGTVMFLPGFFYTAEAMREMKSDYGIVPFPKYNEEQDDYYSDVHDIMRLMVIPKTCKDVDAVSAVLEEMAFVGYTDVLTPYYNVVMKNKYSRDSVSAEMLDIIRNNCSPDLSHIVSFNAIGYLQRKLIQAKSSDFASTYVQYYSGAQEKLDKYIEMFQNSID